MAVSQVSCPLGALDTLELISVLESRRESAMVSIDITTMMLIPGVTSRTYKSWIAQLDPTRRNRKYYSPPGNDRRGALIKAIRVLDKCLEQGLLPKTRTEIYRAGERVTAYKKRVLKELKNQKVNRNV